MEGLEEGYFHLDLSDDEWKEIRRLAEAAMHQNLFDQDPVKCVINSYITLVMIKQEFDSSDAFLH